jgi:hypothetical protein
VSADPTLTEAQLLEEDFRRTEQDVRQGLGPEAGLIDVLKRGLAAEALARSEDGRRLIHDCAVRATEILQDIGSDPTKITAERAFAQVLALSLELGILRRVAATICAGKNAERGIVEAGREQQVHGEDRDGPQE